MNIQEYISSGIIETYVLGLASPEEEREFERLCMERPEVQAAREAFEKELESRLSQNRIIPPRELKSGIFSQIGIEEKKQASQHLGDRPAVIRGIRFLRLVAAASVILMAASVMLNAYLFVRYKRSVAQYNELTQSQSMLANSNQSLNTRLKRYETAIDQMKDPGMEIVKMPAVATSPSTSSLATVYWNTSSHAVWVLVNRLPKPADDKQYQLWAIVDGQPVDAGIFDMDAEMSFVQLKTIARAQAFAITLEKKGGSGKPTMDAMYVMGKVAG